MVLTFAERNVKQYALNRATGSERTSKMVRRCIRLASPALR